MQWYLKVVKDNYANFNGRATRQEFWMFSLINYGFIVVTSFLDGFLGTFGAIYGIYSLAVLVPNLAVSIRRMHDVGKSGWVLLIPIYNFILMVTSSDASANKYGDPE